MWGLTWRSALQLLAIPLLAAFGARFLGYLAAAITDGRSTPDDGLYHAIVWVSSAENLVLVGVAALVLAFGAGAIVEGRRGV